MTSLNFLPCILISHVRLHARIGSADKPLENLMVEETEVDCTSSSNSSEQQNLLIHLRAKSKCWQFLSFHTDDNGKKLRRNKYFANCVE